MILSITCLWFVRTVIFKLTALHLTVQFIQFIQCRITLAITRNLKVKNNHKTMHVSVWIRFIWQKSTEIINLKDSFFIAYNIWIKFSNSFHNEDIRNMIGLLGNIFSKDVLYCWYVIFDFRGAINVPSMIRWTQTR